MTKNKTTLNMTITSIIGKHIYKYSLKFQNCHILMAHEFINPRKPEYAPHQEKNYLIIE